MTKIKSFIASLIVIAIIAISTAGTANAFYLGQTGQDVADLQISLLEKGYDIPALSSGVARPGYFGVQTQKALALSEASETSSLKLGSVAGPDFYFDYVGNNDVRTYSYRKVFDYRQSSGVSVGTTTPCAFRLPLSATTSAMFASFSNITATSSALTLTIATSTTAYATTSNMATIAIAAGSTREVAWYPTYIAGGNGIAVPGTYVVFGLSGAGGSNGVAINGTCQVEARRI